MLLAWQTRFTVRVAVPNVESVSRFFYFPHRLSTPSGRLASLSGFSSLRFKMKGAARLLEFFDFPQHLHALDDVVEIVVHARDSRFKGSERSMKDRE